MLARNSSTDMAISDLLKPRFIIAIVALVGTVAMMYLETIPTEVGVTIIMGVLAAFGAYYARSPRDRQ